MSVRNYILALLFLSISGLFAATGNAQVAENQLSFVSIDSGILEDERIGKDEHESKTFINKVFFDISAETTYPNFIGLKSYIDANLVYPSIALENHIEGLVLLSLKLAADGRVESAEVIESLGYGCDEAAMEMVMNMPNWIPASNYGHNVPARILLKVNFNLP